jgi:hypothetical protein
VATPSFVPTPKGDVQSSRLAAIHVPHELPNVYPRNHVEDRGNAKENDRWHRHGLQGAISVPFGANFGLMSLSAMGIFRQPLPQL